MKTSILTLFALFLAIGFSCRELENNTDPDIDYEAFALELEANLNRIADDLRNRQSNFSNRKV